MKRLLRAVALVVVVAATSAHAQNQDQPRPRGAGGPGMGGGAGGPMIHSENVNPPTSVMVPSVNTLMGAPTPFAPGTQPSPPGGQPSGSAAAGQKTPFSTVPPAKGKSESGTQPTTAPSATGIEAVPITKEDYKLYMKSGHRDKAWDEFIEPAFTTFDVGNFATSGIFLTRAYEKGCRDPLVLFRLALYREMRGMLKEAIPLYDDVAKDVETRYPGHPLATAIAGHAGRAHYRIEDYAGALPLLTKALAAAPEDFSLLLMCGQMQRMQKQYQEARSLFERALAAKPPENTGPQAKVLVLDELVILTCEGQDYTACQQYVDQVLTINPRDRIGMSYRDLLNKAAFKKKEQEMMQKLVK